MKNQIYQLCRSLVTRPFPVALALFYVCLSVALAETDSSTQEDTVTYANSTNNQTSITDMDMNNKGDDDDKGSGNAGLIAGLVIAALVLVSVIVVFFIIHKRRSRMMDNEKKMKIQMTSARNAGVYQDLTVTVPADCEKPPASPEHERLQSADEV